LLQILENQAHVLAATPVEKVKRNFLAYWERLQSQWQSDPHFAVLGRLWLAESQEHGRDLPSIQLLTSRYRNLVHAWQAMFSNN
jgi:hypothetical protein